MRIYILKAINPEKWIWFLAYVIPGEKRDLFWTWRCFGEWGRSTLNCSQKVHSSNDLGCLFFAFGLPIRSGRGGHSSGNGDWEGLTQPRPELPVASATSHTGMFLSVHQFLLLSVQALEVVLKGSFHHCLFKKYWSSTDYKFLETRLTLAKVAWFITASRQEDVTSGLWHNFK